MRTLAANATLLFVSKALTLGVRVFSLLAMARYAPAGTFACISFAVAGAETARMVADFGTETWSVRAIALAPSGGDQARAVSAALTVKLTASLVVAVLLVALCANQFGRNGILAGACATAMLMASQCSGCAIAYLQAKNQLSRTLVLLLPCAATAAIVAAVLFGSHDAFAALGALAAGELAAATVLLFLLWRDGALFTQRVSSDYFGAMLRECLPVAALNVVVGVYSRLDTLVLAQWSVLLLATYSVANRIFQPFQMALATFSSAVYSRAARKLAANEPGIAAALLADVATVGTLAVALATALWLGGTFVIDVFLPAYANALEPLRLLAVAVVVMGMNFAVTGILQALGKFYWVLAVAALELACAFCGMLLFVPRFGAAGAALAVLVAAVANAIVQYPAAWLIWRRSEHARCPNIRISTAHS